MAFDVTGDAYQRFMGRWSTPLGRALSERARPVPGQRALDVGCGPGNWTQDLVARLGADSVVALDPSPSFVAAARDALPGVDVRRGSLPDLPFEADSFDLAGANLVLHFLPDAAAGVHEMLRVTRPGGVVVTSVWDLAGHRAPMTPVWRALGEVVPAVHLDDDRPVGSARGLFRALEEGGALDVTVDDVVLTLRFDTFDQWWEPHLHGVGPIGEILAALSPEDRTAVARAARDILGPGPFSASAVAFVGRGTVPT